MTRTGLDALLRALHSDTETAAVRYRQLRERLEFFFIRRNLVMAESLADEVLDRMARRIEEGENLATPEAYAHGIARYVAQEQAREALRAGSAARDYARNISPPVDTQYEELLETMTRCLERQDAAARELLREYYLSEGAEKINRRRRLALSLGLSQGALRKRAFRLRAEVEACVRARLGGEQKKPK